MRKLIKLIAIFILSLHTQEVERHVTPRKEVKMMYIYPSSLERKHYQTREEKRERVRKQYEQWRNNVHQVDRYYGHAN